MLGSDLHDPDDGDDEDPDEGAVSLKRKWLFQHKIVSADDLIGCMGWDLHKNMHILDILSLHQEL